MNAYDAPSEPDRRTISTNAAWVALLLCASVLAAVIGWLAHAVWRG